MGSSGTVAAMTPEAALDRVMHCLDRAHDKGFRAKAFQRARDVVRTTDPAEIAERAAAGTLKKLDGIGDSSAKVIIEALAGEVPHYLAPARGDDPGADHAGGRALPATPCAATATCTRRGATAAPRSRRWRRPPIALGHEYMVLTDHSARLTIAHGLDRERLERQLADIEALNAGFDDFRILTGMEVDIFEDGTLDLDDDLLERLDVVVASVHSKLRMERQPMTERMVVAVANPHVDILGHCTGRMIGRRPPSTFDADYVFAACKQFGTAVEINCRPERLDPPRELLDVAIDYGCWFSIDTDAHATGQLEWQPHGCDRAAEREVPIERVINTMSADDLLGWTATVDGG